MKANEWYEKGVECQSLALTSDTRSEMVDWLEKARAAFEQALGGDSPHALAWFQIANVLEQLERHEAALGYLNQFLARHPDDVDGWLHKARLLAEIKRPAECLAACAHVMRRQPDDLETRHLKASALEELGFPGEALAAWDDVLRPGDVQVCDHTLFHAGKDWHLLNAAFRRADALVRLGRRDEARAAYREAMRNGWEHMRGPMGLWAARASLAAFEEAREAYEEVKAAPPPSRSG